MARTQTEREKSQAGGRAPVWPMPGYTVRDPMGRKVGRVEKLHPNGGGEAEYVMTKTGFLGLKSVLLPAGMVEVDEGRRTLTLQ